MSKKGVKIPGKSAVLGDYDESKDVLDALGNAELVQSQVEYCCSVEELERATQEIGVIGVALAGLKSGSLKPWYGKVEDELSLIDSHWINASPDEIFDVTYKEIKAEKLEGNISPSALLNSMRDCLYDMSNSAEVSKVVKIMSDGCFDRQEAERQISLLEAEVEKYREIVVDCLKKSRSIFSSNEIENNKDLSEYFVMLWGQVSGMRSAYDRIVDILKGWLRLLDKAKILVKLKNSDLPHLSEETTASFKKVLDWARGRFLIDRGVKPEHHEYFSWLNLPLGVLIDIFTNHAPKEFENLVVWFQRCCFKNEMLNVLFGANGRDYTAIKNPFGAKDYLYKPLSKEFNLMMLKVASKERHMNVKKAPRVIDDYGEVSVEVDGLLQANIQSEAIFYVGHEPYRVYQWLDEFNEGKKLLKHVGEFRLVVVNSCFSGNGESNAGLYVKNVNLIESKFDVCKRTLSDGVFIGSEMQSKNCKFIDQKLVDCYGCIEEAELSKFEIKCEKDREMLFKFCTFNEGKIEIKEGMKFVGCTFQGVIDFDFADGVDLNSIFVGCDFSKLTGEVKEFMRPLIENCYFAKDELRGVLREITAASYNAGSCSLNEGLGLLFKHECDLMTVSGEEPKVLKWQLEESDEGKNGNVLNILHPLGASEFDKIRRRQSLIRQIADKGLELNGESGPEEIVKFFDILDAYEGGFEEACKLVGFPIEVFNINRELLTMCIERVGNDKVDESALSPLNIADSDYTHSASLNFLGSLATFMIIKLDNFIKVEVVDFMKRPHTCWGELPDKGEKIVMKGVRSEYENCVPNDIEINTKNGELICIQGPNMEGGKSSLKNAISAVTLRSQMGLPVAADYAATPREAALDSVYFFQQQAEADVFDDNNRKITSDTDKRAFYLSKVVEHLLELANGSKDKKFLIVIDELMKGCTTVVKTMTIEATFLMTILNKLRGQGVIASALDVLHEGAVVDYLMSQLQDVTCYAVRPDSDPFHFTKGGSIDSDPEAAMSLHNMDALLDPDVEKAMIEATMKRLEAQIAALKGTP